MTIVDLTKGCFEIIETKNKTAEYIGVLLDHAWFSRYPRLVQATFNNSNEFLGKDFKEILNSYSVMPKSTTIKNP